jgi:hypothetical protein
MKGSYDEFSEDIGMQELNLQVGRSKRGVNPTIYIFPVY